MEVNERRARTAAAALKHYTNMQKNAKIITVVATSAPEIEKTVKLYDAD